MVTIGYADGLPRGLPRPGRPGTASRPVLPHGGAHVHGPAAGGCDGRAPVCAPGDDVTLLGAEGGNILQAEELATRCGTITNELLSRLGPRLELV